MTLATWAIYEWRRSGIADKAHESLPSHSDDGEGISQYDRSEKILALWRQHPGYGPSQVRNMLRRNGVRASVSTVRRVMEANGYVSPQMKPKAREGRYETGPPRELYHLDFYHFFCTQAEGLPSFCSR